MRELARVPVRPTQEDDELHALFEEVRNSPKISTSDTLTDLFTYFFKHRHDHIPGETIWKQVLKEKASYENDGPSGKRVRERCCRLRDVLQDYFPETRAGWRFDLPCAVQSKGTKLQWVKVDDPQSLTRAFWAAHLDAPADISVVYVEQLFFENPRSGLVFRYYDCNAERSADGLNELKERHPDAYKNEAPFPTYPYVAWGDVEARNLITQWFDTYTLTKVEPVLTRELHYDRSTWKHSLILFGSAPSNRFITETLQSYPDLPIRLQGRARVIIEEPTAEEKARIDEFCRRRYLSEATCEDGKCTVDFNPEKGIVPVILTRVANPHTKKVPVTLINSDFGSAVHQMTEALTDEQRLEKALEFLNAAPPLPSAFQLLCGVSIRTEQGLQIHALAWRPYTPIGI
jgi:hypothetical protein